MPMVEECWQCDQCGYPNDLERWPCKICRYPLTQDTAARKKVEGAFKDTLGTVTPQPSDSWECSHCKCVNSSSSKHCTTCYTTHQAIQAEKKRADATEKRLQQSMDGIYSILPSSVDADELKGDIPSKQDENWLRKSRMCILLQVTCC